MCEMIIGHFQQRFRCPIQRIGAVAAVHVQINQTRRQVELLGILPFNARWSFALSECGNNTLVNSEPCVL